MPLVNEEVCQSTNDNFDDAENTFSNDDIFHEQPHVCESQESKEQPNEVNNSHKNENVEQTVDPDILDQPAKPARTIPPAPGWAISYHIPNPPMQMFQPLLALNLFNSDQDNYSQPCLSNDLEENLQEEQHDANAIDSDDQLMASEQDSSSQSGSASNYDSATEEQPTSPQPTPSPQRQRRPKRHCPKPMFQYDDIISAKRRKK